MIPAHGKEGWMNNSGSSLVLPLNHPNVTPSSSAFLPFGLHRASVVDEWLSVCAKFSTAGVSDTTLNSLLAEFYDLRVFYQNHDQS
jgi:hypothetical protein